MIETAAATKGIQAIIDESQEEPNQEFILGMKTDAIKSLQEDSQAVREAPVESSMTHSKYLIEDMDKYVESLKGLTFLELTQLLKKTTDDLELLHSSKSLFDSYMEMNRRMNSIDGTPTKVADLSMNEKIGAINYLKDNGHDDVELEDFMDRYNEYEATLARIIKEASGIVDEIPNKDSAMFLNSEMKRYFDKRLNRLEDKSPSDNVNLAYDRKKIEYARMGFDNPLSLDELSARVEKVISNKRTMKKICKEVESNKYMDSLQHIYSDKLISNAIKLLSEIFDYNGNFSGLTMIIILNHISRVETLKGKDSYIRTLLLNLSSITTGNFDIGDPNEYKKSISSLFGNNIKIAADYIYAHTKNRNLLKLGKEVQ